MKLMEFLQEANGDLSSARLFAFLVVLLFCVDWGKHIWMGQVFDPSLTIVGIVLGVLGLKVSQKFGEEKNAEKAE